MIEERQLTLIMENKPGALVRVVGSFHQNLRDSDGLKPQKRTSISFDEAPDRVKAAYEIVIPHYEHLRHYKID